MILGVYKPAGLTSHDVVKEVRRLTGEKRVGHGGTLDPFAEGVLVIGISRDSTKKLHNILKDTDKEYVATLELGKTSTTGDPEGAITTTTDKLKDINKQIVTKTLEKFEGKLEQTPPDYSAVKVDGVPAYKLARAGRKPELKKRVVEIKNLELVSLDLPELTIKVTVSSGTYIRVLAEDIGKELGVGAYTKKLIRTRVGDFKIGDCIAFPELEKELKSLYN